jgi:hypothetical protein
MCVDDQMFPVRLVPHGHDVRAELLGVHDRPQLCLALAGKTVANSHAVLGQDHCSSPFW